MEISFSDFFFFDTSMQGKDFCKCCTCVTDIIIQKKKKKNSYRTYCRQITEGLNLIIIEI